MKKDRNKEKRLLLIVYGDLPHHLPVAIIAIHTVIQSLSYRQKARKKKKRIIGLVQKMKKH